jgi:hypothetical protein
VATWFTQSSGDQTGMAFDGDGEPKRPNFDGNTVSKFGLEGAFLSLWVGLIKQAGIDTVRTVRATHSIGHAVHSPRFRGAPTWNPYQGPAAWGHLGDSGGETGVVSNRARR